MTEKKNPAQSVKKIKCHGPVSKKNGAVIFVLPRKGNKKDLEFLPGQTAVVGKDVTEEEAKQLLNSKTWKFSEVK